jgi:hypothetical protein
MLLGPTVVLAQSTDLIDCRDLGDRGIAFETLWAQRFSSLDSVAGAGDVNGDGFSDLLFSGIKNAEGDPPFALLVLGRGGFEGRHALTPALPDTVVFRYSGAIRYQDFRVFGPAGDLDGDGLDDLLLGLPYYPSDANETAGRAYVIYGSRDFPPEIVLEDVGTSRRGVVFTSTDPYHDGIGKSALSPGDVDGDGVLDLVVGAPHSTNFKGQVLAGVIFVLTGVDGLPATVDLARVGDGLPGVEFHGNPEVLPPETAAQLGYDTIGFLGNELEAAGDVDGDGFADFTANEPDPYPPPTYLIRGGRALPALTDVAEAASHGNITVFRGLPEGFGMGAVAGVGDLDGDARGELMVGLGRHSSNPFITEQSGAHLIPGRDDWPSDVDLSSGRPALAATVFRAVGAADLLGSEIAPVGDVNGDGRGDFAIGAPRASVRGQRNAGQACVIFGQASYPDEVRLSQDFDGLRILGETSFSNLGGGISPAGDFNGDGAADFLVSAIHFAVVDDVSRAYLIYGTGSGPAPLRLYRAEPPQGGMRGGIFVKLLGSGFAGTPRVLFGGNPAGMVHVQSGSVLSVLLPPGDRLGPADVAIEQGGETRMLAGGFEYTPDFPEIDLADLGSRGLVITGDEREPGASVAFGDLTGDGRDDLVLATGALTGWIVTIVKGGPGLPAALPAFTSSERVTLVTSSDLQALHALVAVLGDVNGDALADLAIGTDGGGAFLLFGRRDLPPELLIEEEVFAGRAVQLERGDLPPGGGAPRLVPLGDFTGDGLADFALAHPLAPGFSAEAGEVVFIAGRNAWPDPFDLGSAALVFARLSGSAPGDRLGTEAAAAGDVDGDGAADLIVAAESPSGAGRAYIVFVNPGLPAAADVEDLVLGQGGVALRLNDGFEHFGELHLAAAGDTDGDGHADVLLGVEDGGVSTQGVAYLVHGGAELPVEIHLTEAAGNPAGVTRFFGRAAQVQCGRIGPAGDFNADGLADFLVASQPDLSALPAIPWSVFIALGKPGLPEKVDLRTPGGIGLELVGPRLAQVSLQSRNTGDLNGDGQPDFVLTESGSFTRDPGRVHVVFGPFGGTTFRRGDANFDARIEISDAIFGLAYLFLGGEAPRCADAVDADDDGGLNLTDAVFLLNHLFTGGRAPPPPYPEEGVDPTADGLSCRGF